MSCWQRSDWTEFFQCAYAHLAEPVYIWFPFGLIYLVIVAVGGGLGVALMLGAVKVFGRDRVLDWFELPFKRIGDAVSYPFTLYSLRRFRRQVDADVQAQAEAAAARERALKEEQ